MITIPETEISSRGLHELHRTIQQRRNALPPYAERTGEEKLLNDALLELEAAALFGAELLECEPEEMEHGTLCVEITRPKS